MSSLDSSPEQTLEFLSTSTRATRWERTDFFSGRVLTEAAVHCWGHHSFWVFLALGMTENQVVLAFVWGLFDCVDILSQSTLVD